MNSATKWTKRDSTMRCGHELVEILEQGGRAKVPSMWTQIYGPNMQGELGLS